MANDFTLFMQGQVEEQALLRFFDRHVGFRCSSLDFPNDDAPAVLMCLKYPEGFPLGVSLCWPRSLELAMPLGRLAQTLADEFKLDVLFEGEESVSDTDQEQWFLATPGLGEPHIVRVQELQHGICVAET